MPATRSVNLSEAFSCGGYSTKRLLGQSGYSDSYSDRSLTANYGHARSHRRSYARFARVFVLRTLAYQGSSEKMHKFGHCRYRHEELLVNHGKFRVRRLYITRLLAAIDREAT